QLGPFGAGGEAAMTFTELPFWLLTAVVFVLWLCCRSNYRATVVLLLTSSLVFYGYHRWSLLPLVLLTVSWTGSSPAGWCARGGLSWSCRSASASPCSCSPTGSTPRCWSTRSCRWPRADR